MDVELLIQLQLVELRQRLLGKPVAMDVPVGAGVSQEALPLARRETLPQCRRESPNAGDRLAPVATTALHIVC